MKQIIFAVILWIGLCLIQGCEKELEKYNGTEGVYFGSSIPASSAEFINIAGDTSAVKIRIMTTGRVKDYDRNFRLVIDNDSTTAVAGREYTPPAESQLIKAGTCYTDVVIPVYRTEFLKKEELRFHLKLEPTSDFVIGIPIWFERSPEFDADRHIVRMSDFIVRPEIWNGYESSIDHSEKGYWGVFSEKKYRLICEKFNLVYKDFSSKEKMPNAKQRVIREVMADYLQELYDANTPILEEDRRLMWFEGVSWTSVVGVPWVPEK